MKVERERTIMQTTSLLCLHDHEKMEVKVIHFALDTLLPADQKLALNLETRTMSLLADGPQLVVQQQFSVNEMHMIMPMLDYFPHYCPYEVLVSHLTSKIVSPAAIDQCRKRLQESQRLGSWHQELRPVRRAISSLRAKLLPFYLGISNVRERGCCLIGMPHEFHLHL